MKSWDGDDDDIQSSSKGEHRRRMQTERGFHVIMKEQGVGRVFAPEISRVWRLVNCRDYNPSVTNSWLT